MVQLGKIVFRKLQDEDLDDLKIFCEACSTLGYYNNDSFKSIKLDKMKMPYGQYFIGYDLEKKIIFNLCGVHQMTELSQDAYRVFFRGATLPGYGTGKTGYKSSFQLMEILNLQIDFILENNPAAEFYFTTNRDHLPSNGKSQRMDAVMAPRVARNGIFDIVEEDFVYMNTRQKLWRVNVSKYKDWRLR
jgi:hypothetical protein